MIISFSFSLKNNYFQALVAHACHPSYSGGRDQEDQGLQNSF
jgi:hypothetical protein